LIINNIESNKLTKKYKNPPLILVKSKIWWHINSQDDFNYSKIISGLLFGYLSEIEESIEVIQVNNGEVLKSTFVNQNDKLEIIYECGSNEVSVVTTDGNYSWEYYYEKVTSVFDFILSFLESKLKTDHIHASLEYQDFFESQDNIRSYSDILKSLKVNLTFPIFSNPKDVFLSFNTIENDLNVSTSFISFKYNQNSGIKMTLKVDSDKIYNFNENTHDWFNKSHEYCSKTFEQIIEGEIKNNLDYAE